MGDSFFKYLVQVELMAFFSGYPLFYAVVRVVVPNVFRTLETRNRLISHLPHAYALVATLYLALQLKNLFPDFSFAHTYLPYLKSWAILAILFWIPQLARKPLWSLLHSFVFFFYIIRDLLLQMFETNGDVSIVKNDMKLFSVSLLLHLVAFVAILLASLFLRRFVTKNRK